MIPEDQFPFQCSNNKNAVWDWKAAKKFYSASNNSIFDSARRGKVVTGARGIYYSPKDAIRNIKRRQKETRFVDRKQENAAYFHGLISPVGMSVALSSAGSGGPVAYLAAVLVFLVIGDSNFAHRF